MDWRNGETKALKKSCVLFSASIRKSLRYAPPSFQVSGDIRDLKGKRVNIGRPGSGSTSTCPSMPSEAVGIDWQKDLKAEGAKATEAPGLIQEGRLEAFFYTVGHPSEAFEEAHPRKHPGSFHQH